MKEYTFPSDKPLTKLELDILVANSGNHPDGVAIRAGCHPDAGLKVYYNNGEVFANCSVCKQTAVVFIVSAA
jgi:hypothetical protein